MDRVLVFGDYTPLRPLFARLGLEVVPFDSRSSIADLPLALADIVVATSEVSDSAVELINFIRNDTNLRHLPVVAVGALDAQTGSELIANDDRLESVSAEASPGLVAAKVAKLLRLRKFNGADPVSATLDEMNANLRDMNERLLRERLEAKKLQKALLPESLPSSPRFQVAAHYAPLDEVGGDWYYVRAIEASTVVAQVADATGHGLAASLLSSMTKLAMGAAWHESPEELLGGMNRLMAPHLPEGRFVTMGAILVDAVSGRLRVASAGHPPPLVHRAAKGKVDTVKTKGFALGFLEEATYELTTTQLERGDSVVLYTDGIIEASNRGNEMYGIDSLAAVLSGLPGALPPDQLIDAVLADFNAFIDGRALKDDITLVVVQRR